MTSYIDLIGKSEEEIDKAMLASHKKVLEYIQLYKEGKVDWNDINSIQISLMEATGYQVKISRINRLRADVSFEDTIFPSNELRGAGKNELEAIINACQNLFDDPQHYNTSSIKYINELKGK